MAFPVALQTRAGPWSCPHPGPLLQSTRFYGVNPAGACAFPPKAEADAAFSRETFPVVLFKSVDFLFDSFHFGS